MSKVKEVSNNNDLEAPSAAVATGTVEGRCVPAEYSFLPETHDLFWKDDFFDDDDGIIAVFDFDYDKMKAFQTPIKVAGQIFGIINLLFIIWVIHFCFSNDLITIDPIFVVPVAVVGAYLLMVAPFFLRRQVQWEVESNHLAITRDGIRFVKDRRKSCWGWQMCDIGKTTKTVAFDMITDCDIIEPAGNFLLLFPQSLYVVNVDTPSLGGARRGYELTINGLKEAQRFKSLVWALKRAPNMVAAAESKKRGGGSCY